MNDTLDQVENESSVDEEINCSENDVEHEKTTCNGDRKRLAAFFLLKTREEREVTQVALNGIVQDFRCIWRDAMERLQVRIYPVCSY